MSESEKATPTVRNGQGSAKLDEAEFKRRYRYQFFDPAFDAASAELDRITQIAWEAYSDSRKSPRTVKAGGEFADPNQDLSVEWLETRRHIQEAQKQFEDQNGPNHILVISASPRTDETCPSEMAKSFRLASVVREELKAGYNEIDSLDLSNLAAEYGRKIFPCKACVSTAMPLCHWPCSCYPNHYMGQVQDWMNELYPRWVRAHGIIIITPVHWYQAPSALKLMMDRLVCADGGNPDPTTTEGKDPAKAKAIEMNGWAFPKHLKERRFAIIAHGDSEGADNVRRDLYDWLIDMELVAAGGAAVFDRYIGYYEPYATSHDSLDKDEALFKEVRNAAAALIEAVGQMRSGIVDPSSTLKSPRPK